MVVRIFKIHVRAPPLSKWFNNKWMDGKKGKYAYPYTHDSHQISFNLPYFIPHLLLWFDDYWLLLRIAHNIGVPKNRVLLPRRFSCHYNRAKEAIQKKKKSRNRENKNKIFLSNTQSIYWTLNVEHWTLSERALSIEHIDKFNILE